MRLLYIGGGVRSKAFDDMKKSILKTDTEIFISGIGVKTAFSNVFLDEKVLDHSDYVIEENKDFNIHIIACDNEESAKRLGKDIKATFKQSNKLISKFTDAIQSRIKPKDEAG